MSEKKTLEELEKRIKELERQLAGNGSRTKKNIEIGYVPGSSCKNSGSTSYAGRGFWCAVRCRKVERTD